MADHLGSDLLAGKNLLITGVITEASMAFHTARLAQEQGANGGAHRVRPAVAGGADRQAAARAGAGGRAGRHRPGRSWTRWPTGSASTWTGSTGCCTRSASRRPRRSAATSWTPVGGRRDRRAHVRVLAQVAGRGGAAADDRRRRDRRARLRRPSGLAGLRLDGRGQGRAGVGHPVPGPRPGPEGDPGQPGLRRAGPDDGGQVDPRLRRSGERLERAGRRWAGTPPTRRRWPGPACALLSDWFPATTGSMVMVDGGFHALGFGTEPRSSRREVAAPDRPAMARGGDGLLRPGTGTGRVRARAGAEIAEGGHHGMLATRSEHAGRGRGGKVKEGVGKVTGNESLEARARPTRPRPNVKQAGDKGRDAAKDVFDR